MGDTAGGLGPKKPNIGFSPLAQISMFWRGQGVRFTANFSLKEFECKCGGCTYTLVDQDHVERLQRLRNILSARYNREVSIKITSGFRCFIHNRNVGGKNQSQHCYGTATDIVAPNVPILELHQECVRIFDGVGLYDTFIHVDSRGFEERWDSRSVKAKKGAL